MQDIINQFINALKSAGCEPENHADIKADDKWNSFRIVGQKPNRKAGWYQLKIDGDFGIGRFGDFREGISHPWHSKSEKKWSDEEKNAWKARIEADKKHRELQQDRIYADRAKELSDEWDAATPAINHPYLEKKGILPHTSRILGEDLLIPMYGADGLLWAYQSIDSHGNKLYMRDAKKQGCYCPLVSKSDPREVFIICEGFSTGASIRQAMKNIPVIIAFDAGNLSSVAKIIREKYPKAKIVIAADNDRFKDKNTGKVKGEQAAVRVNGFIAMPEFPDDDLESSDYNDLHQKYGLQSVIDSLAATSAAIQEAPESIHESTSDDVADFVGDSGSNHFEIDTNDELQGDLGMPFKVLGHNDDKYYYFPFKARVIVELSATAHNINNFLRLATLQEWEGRFGKDGDISDSRMVRYAMAAMTDLAHERGSFYMEDRVRGCGAWMDAGRSILHCGDMLLVDGTQIDPLLMKSRYTYISAPKLLRPAIAPLTSSEAYKLREVCEAVSWENKLSGSLLAGWLVLAPICSALAWRPHVWLTGEAESGKSTVLNRIIKPVLGDMALKVTGGTTEAAIRNIMGYNGRPIIYDEAESGVNKNIIDGVIELARKSSDGNLIGKHGQKLQRAQWMMLFAGINPPVDKTADESRIIFLNIKKNRKSSSQRDYDRLLEKIDESITDNFSNRLLARVINNLPNIIKNIEIFKKAVRKVVKGARASDQIGTVLAGLYLLSNVGVVSEADAEKWVMEQDWSMHTNINEAPDPIRLIQYISTSLVRYVPMTGNARDVSLGDLISSKLHKVEGIDEKWADKTLRQHGILVKNDGIIIANRSHNLGKLLKDTDWRTRWSRTLSDIPGSEKKRGVYFSSGDTQDGVRIPTSLFMDEEEYNRQQNVVEIDFGKAN